MKNIIFLLLVSSFVLVNCSKTFDQDCTPSSECRITPLDSGLVVIKNSFTEGAQGIPMILYEGYLEDNVILWADTMYQKEVIFKLPLKKRYAAEAYYKVGNKFVIALDGQKLKEKTTNDCGAKCYEEARLELNVKQLK